MQEATEKKKSLSPRQVKKKQRIKPLVASSAPAPTVYADGTGDQLLQQDGPSLLLDSPKSPTGSVTEAGEVFQKRSGFTGKKVKRAKRRVSEVGQINPNRDISSCPSEVWDSSVRCTNECQERGSELDASEAPQGPPQKTRKVSKASRENSPTVAPSSPDLRGQAQPSAVPVPLLPAHVQPTTSIAGSDDEMDSAPVTEEDVGFRSSSLSPKIPQPPIGFHRLPLPARPASLIGIHASLKAECSLSTEVCRFYSRHLPSVDALSFTHDGRWLGVGRAFGRIDVFSVDDYRHQIALPGGEDQSVRSLMFCPKSSPSARSDSSSSLLDYRLFTTGLHGLLTEWDVRTQTSKAVVSTFGGAVFAAALSVELGLIVTASDDGAARLFKINSKAGAVSVPKPSLTTIKPSTSSRKPSKSSKHSDASGSQSRNKLSKPQDDTDSSDDDSSSSDEDDDEDDVYKEDLLQYWKCLSKHAGRLLSVCFYKDEYVFAGTADSLVIRWNLKTGIADAKLAADRDASLGGAPDALRLTRNRDRYDYPTLAFDSQVWSILPLPTHGVVVSGDSLGKVIFWDVATSTALKVFHQHPADVLQLTCSSDESTVIAAGVGGKISIYVVTGTGEWIVGGARHPHVADIKACAMSSLGRIAAGAADGKLALFVGIGGGSLQAVKSRIVHIPDRLGVGNAQGCISVSPASNLVQTVHPDRVEIWDISNQEKKKKHAVEHTPPDHEQSDALSRKSASVSPHAIKVASIHLEDGGCWREIRCAHMSSDGALIAISNDTGTRLFSFDIRDLTIGPESLGVRHLICSAIKILRKADGTLWLICGVVGTTKTTAGRLLDDDEIRIEIWDLQSRKRIAVFDDDLACAPKVIQTSPDDRKMLVVDAAGSATLFSLESNQKVATLPPFPSLFGKPPMPAAAFAFSPNSTHLAAVTHDGRLYFYDLQNRTLELRPLTQIQMSRSRGFRGLFRVPVVVRRNGMVNLDELIERMIWVDPLGQAATIQPSAEQQSMGMPLKLLMLANRLIYSVSIDRELVFSENSVKDTETEAVDEMDLDSATGESVNTECRIADECCSVTRYDSDSILGLELLDPSGDNFAESKSGVSSGKANKAILLVQSPEAPAEDQPLLFKRKRYGT